MEFETFTLEKIQDFIQPIESIESKLSLLNSIYDEINEKKSLINNLDDKDFKAQFNILYEKVLNITEDVRKSSQENLNTYFKIYDHLTKKHKDKLKNRLLISELDKEKLYNLGLYLIDNKEISRVISQSSYIKSLNFELWSDILDSLKQNTLFINAIENLEGFYSKILEQKFELEMNTIPEDTDENLIRDYKKMFFENPDLAFDDFLSNLESKLTKEELKKRKKVIEETKQRKKLDELKKSQELQRETYEEYLKYSEEEFQRRRRRQKRKTLTDLVSKSGRGDEVTEDIKEKIDNFKKKFNNKFEDKYLVQKEGEQDPLDLIRERKDRKQKEYKKHIKKFETDNNE
jgi:hypothetical protein